MVCNDLFHHVNFFFFFFFFAIADLKIFSWCNVIQQIKKVSPYIGHKFTPDEANLNAMKFPFPSFDNLAQIFF